MIGCVIQEFLTGCVTWSNSNQNKLEKLLLISHQFRHVTTRFNRHFHYKNRFQLDTFLVYEKMSSTEINVFFENPGLDHIGEKILSFLDFQTLLVSRFVCSSWKGITENSRFWLEVKKVLRNLPAKHHQKEWKKLISFSKVFGW